MQTKIDIYKYSRYRNTHALMHAMKQFCCARVTDKGARGKCPSQSCPKYGFTTLRTANHVAVAYCNGCYRSFDALQIVAESMSIGLRAACDVLELFGEDT